MHQVNEFFFFFFFLFSFFFFLFSFFFFLFSFFFFLTILPSHHLTISPSHHLTISPSPLKHNENSTSLKTGEKESSNFLTKKEDLLSTQNQNVSGPPPQETQERVNGMQILRQRKRIERKNGETFLENFEI